MNLRTIRIAKGLSVQKLADLSNLHRRTIQDIESRGDCLVSTALTLARALQVSMDELCTDQKQEG